MRLIGPKPRWARRDGGEAGLHPSNIHDNAYAVGALDFTGDMPIILGPDGPSLGGFVCPFVVIQADLWKVGQLAPGDTIQLKPLTTRPAAQSESEQDEFVATLKSSKALPVRGCADTTGNWPLFLNAVRVLARCIAVKAIAIVLVEYGPNVLDLTLRLRVHALMLEIERLTIPGVIDVTPGIRSVQVHYDSRVLASGAAAADAQGGR